MRRIFIAVLALLNISISRVVYALPSTSNPHSVIVRRDLGDLLGNSDDNPFLAPISETFPSSIHFSKSSEVPNGRLGFASETLQTTHSITPLYSYSMSNTLGSQTVSGARSSSTASTTSETAETTVVATTASTSDYLSRDSNEWKVIGVAVIVIGGVAGAAVLVIFFDKWWRFVRDVVVGRSKRAGTEFLVPDWEKGSWKAREDSCQYLSSRPHQDGDLRHPFPPRPSPSPHFPQPSQEALDHEMDTG